MNKIRFFVIFIVSCFAISSLFANAGNADIGAKLFQGTQHFKNGGVSCVACHTVNSKLVIGGGKLALNLTSMGGAGIAYTILKPENATSPIMKDAFKGKPITATEQADLVAFFNKVASEKAQSSNSTSSFVIKGIVGAIILFILLSLLGSRRKKESVNQKIYDRQLKSSWKESSK